MFNYVIILLVCSSYAFCWVKKRCHVLPFSQQQNHVLSRKKRMFFCTLVSLVSCVILYIRYIYIYYFFASGNSQFVFSYFYVTCHQLSCYHLFFSLFLASYSFFIYCRQKSLKRCMGWYEICLSFRPCLFFFSFWLFGAL